MKKEQIVGSQILKSGNREVVQKPSLERLLSGIYNEYNYNQMEPNFNERIGTAGFLVTNEYLNPDTTLLAPAPDGYLVGVGNGALWMMLALFANSSPKGVISFDFDPSVVLSGKLLIDIARRGMTSNEARLFLFGSNNTSLQDIARLAEDIVSRESNVKFKKKLQTILENGSFLNDVMLARTLEKNDSLQDIRRRRTAGPIISDNWYTISKLAQEGRIFFLHSNAGNSFSVDYITSMVPEIKSTKNVLYSSNLVDVRYDTDLSLWRNFNKNRQSWYAHTTQYVDNYALRITKSQPIFPPKH